MKMTPLPEETFVKSVNINDGELVVRFEKKFRTNYTEEGAHRRRRT